MKRLINLTVFQLAEKIDLESFKTRKSAAKVISIRLAFITAWTLLIFGILDRGVVHFLGFPPDYWMIGFVVGVIIIISFFTSMSSIIVNLFYASDNSFLLAFPVKTNEVFFSKLIYLIVLELRRSLTFILPLLIAFGMVAGLGVGFFLLIPVYLFVIALLPMLMAGALSIPTVYLLQLLKKNSVIAVSFFIVVMSLLAFLFWQGLSQLDVQISFFAAWRQIYYMTIDFASSVTRSLWLTRHIADMIFLQNNVIPFIIVLGFMFGCLGIILLAVRPFYFHMAMLGSHHKPKKSKPRQNQTKIPKSAFTVFAKKEAIIMFRSPNLLFNFFLFTLLMPFIIFAANTFLNIIEIRSIGEQIKLVANAGLIMLVAMSSNGYSASAVSREGGVFYLTKTSPLSLRSQMLAKIFFNTLIATPMILVSCIIVTALTGATWWQMTFVFLAITVINVAHMFWSFEIDMLRAKVGGLDDTQVTENNANMGTSILIGLALAVLATAYFGLNVFFEQQWLIWIKVLVFPILFVIIRFYLLDIKLKHAFNSI